MGCSKPLFCDTNVILCGCLELSCDGFYLFEMQFELKLEQPYPSILFFLPLSYSGTHAISSEIVELRL